MKGKNRERVYYQENHYNRWKKRKNIWSKTICDKEKKIESVNYWLENKLPTVLLNFTLENVCDADKTALYYLAALEYVNLLYENIECCKILCCNFLLCVHGWKQRPVVGLSDQSKFCNE